MALLKPLAAALSCLLVPVTSISNPLNAAVPLSPVVPMSRLVVPCSGPVPAAKLMVTLRLAGKPTTELLPNASCELTTG